MDLVVPSEDRMFKGGLGSAWGEAGDCGGAAECRKSDPDCWFGSELGTECSISPGGSYLTGPDAAP